MNSNVMASSKPINLIKDKIGVFGDTASIGLNYDIIKGNQEPSPFSVNDLSGNFYENKDEFYRIVSLFKFTELDTLYKVILNDARVLPYNEVFMNMLNNFFNENFMKCLYNYYKHAPAFFNMLFPVNKEYLPKQNKNQHLSFQKYYYLICLIQFINTYKDEDEFLALPLEFRNGCLSWAITRFDPNISFQLIGPQKNQTINFDFKGHYETLINISNSITGIIDYNKLVKLQNINDNAFNLLNALINRANAYDKTPNYAREYIVNIDSINLKEKYIESINGNNILKFDLAYIDYGDVLDKNNTSALNEIEIMPPNKITSSILNIKRLENIFNAYSRLKVFSLVINKNTYINDLSNIGKIYLVFEGVQCAGRTILNSENESSGFLTIPGFFTKNENDDFIFNPYYEYTTYINNRTRIKYCKFYLTTNLSHNIANKITPYPLYSNITRMRIFNVPLKIVSKDNKLFKLIEDDEIKTDNETLKAMINNLNIIEFKNLLSLYNSFNDNMTSEDKLILSLDIINKYYSKHIDRIDLLRGNNSDNKINELLTKEETEINKSIIGITLILTTSLINDEFKNNNILYKYDYDTGLLDAVYINNISAFDNVDDLNIVLYNAFNNPINMNTINRLFDKIGIYIDIDSKELAKKYLQQKYTNDIDNAYYNFYKNKLYYIKYDDDLIINYINPVFDDNFIIFNQNGITVDNSINRYSFEIKLISSHSNHDRNNLYLYIPYVDMFINIYSSSYKKLSVFLDNTEMISIPKKLKFVFTKTNYSMLLEGSLNAVDVYADDVLIKHNETTNEILYLESGYGFDSMIMEYNFITDVNINNINGYKLLTLVSAKDKEGNDIKNSYLNTSILYSYIIDNTIYYMDCDNKTVFEYNSETKIIEPAKQYITLLNRSNNINYINPLYCENLLMYNINYDLIFNNLSMCNLNDILNIPYSADISYYNTYPDQEQIDWFFNLASFTFNKCIYEIDGVKTYSDILNIYYNTDDHKIHYNTCKEPNYGFYSSSTIDINIFKPSEFLTSQISTEVYITKYNKDNEGIYKIITPEIKEKLKCFIYDYYLFDVHVDNFTESNIIFEHILKTIEKFNSLSWEYKDEITGILTFNFPKETGNNKINNIIINFCVYISYDFDNDEVILTYIKYKFNDLIDKPLKKAILYNDLRMSDIYICQNILSKDWMLIYDYDGKRYAQERLSIREYIPSNYLYKNSYLLTVETNYIDAIKLNLTIPSTLNILIEPYGHKYIVKNNVLYEYNIITPTISDKTTIIDYSTHNIFINISPYFGTKKYIKQPIYYYRSFVDNLNDNNIIFETKDVIPVHEITRITTKDNKDLNKFNDKNYILNSLFNNMYEYIGPTNDDNPSTYNIEEDSINIHYDKTDIDLSLNWN